MKVTVEDVSPVQKRLKVEIPAQKVDEHINRVVNSLKKSVSIPGFRKGKVPRSIIEREYGPQIKSEVMQSLIEETIGDAIKQSQVTMILEPQLDNASEVEAGKDFVYSVLMDIEPEIEVPDFRKFELVRPKVEVTDEEVEEQLEALRNQFGTVEPVEEQRPLQEGDIAIIDYKAFIDGEEVEELANENYFVEVGKGNFNETFEKGLIGMEKGEEREIEVTYPEDAINSLVAGKTVTYKVTLNNIQKRNKPELDDEFAQRFGIGLKTVEDLKNKLREQIQKDKEEAVERLLREQLFEKLLEGADFEVPERLVEKKLDQMIDNIAGHMQERGVNLEQAGIDEERLREKMREDAIKQVKTELILDKIAEQEKVEIPSDELKKYSDYVEEHYKEMNVDKAQFQAAVFESVLPKLRAKQTIDYLLENVTIKEEDEAAQEESESGS
ncbi:MAG: trigger factor [Thermodesulfobacteria bacterium]|nr:trigger factor [Thermodesulfobacteriota bacterium]